MCVALAIIAMPFTHFPDSTPRMLVVLCALPLGVVCLIAAVRRGDRAALAATVFVAWVVLCAWLADARGMALLGSFGRDTSALVIAAGFGLWAIGRRVTERGRAILPTVLLGCLGLSACFGLLQVLVRASGGGLVGLVGGRAHGLGGGHIYFGATMAGAACLVAVTQRARSWQWCALVFVFAASANPPGSRFPVAVGFVAGIVVLGLRRDVKAVHHLVRRVRRRRAGLRRTSRWSPVPRAPLIVPAPRRAVGSTHGSTRGAPSSIVPSSGGDPSASEARFRVDSRRNSRRCMPRTSSARSGGTPTT